MSRTYCPVPGFFLQDDPDADPKAIGAVPPRFGLKDDSDDRWHKLKDKVQRMNQDADNQTSYKVFLFIRHGQGIHNVAEAKYGREAWDKKWSKLYGDKKLIWGPDPKLTALGESQAKIVNQEWKKELGFGLSVPQTRYCSPMARALKTCLLTFDGIAQATENPVVIVENCREEYGEHTCDQRNTRTWIADNFPVGFVFEQGFSEKDLLWTKERETPVHVTGRAKRVLDDIFDSDENFVAIIAHSGIITGFLSAMGRPRYGLPTGGVLPVLVKSVKLVQS